MYMLLRKALYQTKTSCCYKSIASLVALLGCKMVINVSWLAVNAFIQLMCWQTFSMTSMFFLISLQLFLQTAISLLCFALSKVTSVNINAIYLGNEQNCQSTLVQALDNVFIRFVTHGHMN